MVSYMSPGTYVEEVELGPKPIEGVATSIGGVVGAAERGPQDVPVLVTSFPAYQRTFGSYLNSADHPDTWYLPHGVEGFFQNLGQLLYVVRIASASATLAMLTLMDRGTPTQYAARLVLRVNPGDTFLVVDNLGTLVPGTTLRLDDGVSTEYVTLDPAAFPPLSARLLSLRIPAYATYGVGTAVNQMLNMPTASPSYTSVLTSPAVPGTNRITVAGLSAGANALHPNELLRLWDTAQPSGDEYVVVAALPTNPGDTTIILRHRLALPHAATTTKVERMDEKSVGVSTTLSDALTAGNSVLLVDPQVDPTKKFGPNDIIRFGGPCATDLQSSYCVTAAGFNATRLLLSALHDHRNGETVTTLSTWLTASNLVATLPTLESDTPAGDLELPVIPMTGMTVDAWILIQDLTPALVEYAQIAADPPPAGPVTLRQPLRFPHAKGVTVQVQAPQQDPAKVTRTTLLQEVQVGGSTVLLADPLTAGAWVSIGPAGATEPEYTILGAALAPQLLPLQGAPPIPSPPPVSPPPPSAVTAGHPPGTPVELRTPMLDVQALDNGAWGNGIRLHVEDEDPALVQTTTAGAAASKNDVPLASTSGVEPGTILEILEVSTRAEADASQGDTAIHLASIAGLSTGDILRVGRTDPEFVTVGPMPAVTPATPTTISVTVPLVRRHLAGEPVDRMDVTGLPRMGKVAAVVGSAKVRFDGGGLPFPIQKDWVVRSREFRLTVEWVKPVPGTPRLQVVETETHRYLSLDDRHSRYIGTIVGSTTGPLRLRDRRTEGQSDLIRVNDLLADTQAQIRLGPDLVYEALPGARLRPVSRWLTGGDDDNAGITDATYIGVDNIDPLLRTGLQSLKSHEDISLVAIPGRTTAATQQELIDHCELMRYRVAILDSLPGAEPVSTGAQIPEVQAQRQQYDTKYAALYYPWLQIANPFPLTPALPPQISVPPSAHMMGICARTDVTRGVHKAPANEVIAGILGLQRALTKGEQDVLNIHPMNVNAFRDFRNETRGLRVWGARVITSDDEWKYLNVRRLFNFVERSLEVGTAPYVFEPNDANLWSRVTRSITNFLTSVWRSGGLMGQKADQAFFVKCGLDSTMTQLDLDEGRLIVVVGIAPVFPAEFVIIRIGQWQGGSSLTEG